MNNRDAAGKIRARGRRAPSGEGPGRPETERQTTVRQTVKSLAAAYPWTGGKWYGYEVIAAVESGKDATLLVRQEPTGDLGIVKLARSRGQFRSFGPSPDRGLTAPITSRGLDYVFRPHRAAVGVFGSVALSRLMDDSVFGPLPEQAEGEEE